MSDAKIQGRDFTEVPCAAELQRILECPVCSEVPLPPIFNCPAGHIICGDCRPKLQKCGICRAKYTDSRNFVVEEIVRSSKITCEFREKGCNRAFGADDFQKHLENCEMRPIKCTFCHKDGCSSSEVPFENYSLHLLEVHDFKSLRPECKPFCFSYRLNPFTTTDAVWEKRMCVIHDEKDFISRSFMHENVFHFTLAIIGSESEASKYKVRLRLRQLEDTSARMECVVPVVSIRKSNDEIMEAVHCLVPKEIMKKSICKVEAMGRGKEALVWEIEYQILSKSGKLQKFARWPLQRLEYFMGRTF